MLYGKTLLSLLLFGLLVIFGDVARADMERYEFTANFVQCVKANSGDQENYTTSGNSQSALMNGENLTNNFRGTYWSYMDCLSKEEGGNSRSFVPTATSCPGVNTVIGGHRIYTPPGVSGKRVQMAGVEWICQSGKWQRTSEGSGDTNDGIDGDDTQHCGASVAQKDLCSFEIPEMRHGASLKVYTSPTPSGSDSPFLANGEAVASCDNGRISLSRAVCQINECEVGQEVQWHARTAFGRQTCKGEVAHDGYVEQGEVERRLFSSIVEARTKTEILTGQAKFICDNGRWRKQDNVDASCAVKPLAQLVCKAVPLQGGTYQYYCY